MNLIMVLLLFSRDSPPGNNLHFNIGSSSFLSQRMDCLFIGTVEGKVRLLNPISLSMTAQES